MNDNIMILTIWELFEDDIQPAKKADKAYDYLRSLEDTGVEVDYNLLEGENPYLDQAIAKLHDDEEDEEDQVYEEDEDY